jgi:hypothetical protein
VSIRSTHHLFALAGPGAVDACAPDLVWHSHDLRKYFRCSRMKLTLATTDRPHFVSEPRSLKIDSSDVKMSKMSIVVGKI